MAEKVIHFKLYDGIYRIINPGYDPGPGPENGTYGGLGKALIDVIVGDDKAVLWDTGNGDVDIKSYVEQNITDKPLIVMNSHGHVDHVRGNALFDEVYIKQEDVEVAKSAMALENMHGHPTSDAVKNAKGCTFKFLKDYQEFDLGGRSVKVIPIPGHSLGCIGIIDSKTKILFSGDAVLKRVGVGGTSGPFYKKSLLKLKEQDISDILCGHWVWPLGTEQIDRLIKLVDDFTPDKAFPVISKLGGHVMPMYMTFAGQDFFDPEFAALSFSNVEKFMSDYEPGK